VSEAREPWHKSPFIYSLFVSVFNNYYLTESNLLIANSGFTPDCEGGSFTIVKTMNKR